MTGILLCFNWVGLYYKAFERIMFTESLLIDSNQPYFFLKKNENTFNWRTWVRSRISLLIFGRPALPTRDFQRQKSLKPLRCHFMTVSGFTTTRVDFQSGHICESQAQNSLSLRLSLGRLIVRCWTVSCWRRARFSMIKLLRLTNKPRNMKNSALQMLMSANSS